MLGMDNVVTHNKKYPFIVFSGSNGKDSGQHQHLDTTDSEQVAGTVQGECSPLLSV